MRSALIRLPGHPDAVCDLVAETVVDEYLRRDPDARIRLSVTGGRGAIFVTGDVKSNADFDVSAVVSRTLGACGVMADMEPFVALEPVSPEQSALFLQGAGRPVAVYGYATDESDDMLPTPVSLARRIAKRLEDLRTHDEKLFWLGADGEVLVQISGQKVRISLLVEQGTKPLLEARKELFDALALIVKDAAVEVNAFGANDARGLAQITGASGREVSVYGMAMPAVPGWIGVDPRDAHKAGAWLARSAARSLVRLGARAAMVQCIYEPGGRIPSRIRARDEHGKDRSAEIQLPDLALDRVMSEWWRPGLGVDAVRWGFAGEPGLPWES